MHDHMYPDVSKELAQKRRELAPEIYAAFRAFGQRVFADGALPSKTKQLIAVAVAHVTQCPYCIRGHTELALTKGATETGVDGSDMGCLGDACRSDIRTLDSRHRCDESDGSQGRCVNRTYRTQSCDCAGCLAHTVKQLTAGQARPGER